MFYFTYDRSFSVLIPSFIGRRVTSYRHKKNSNAQLSDPETHISFSRTVVWPAAAADAAAAAAAADTAFGNMLINRPNYYLLIN